MRRGLPLPERVSCHIAYLRWLSAPFYIPSPLRISEAVTALIGAAAHEATRKALSCLQACFVQCVRHLLLGWLLASSLGCCPPQGGPLQTAIRLNPNINPNPTPSDSEGNESDSNYCNTDGRTKYNTKMRDQLVLTYYVV